MATVRLPDGPTLSYQEWGRPDASVIVMLHGLGESGDTWRHVAPVLGEHFRIIAPDARGHGDSEWTETYSFEVMRDDVVKLMDALGVLAAIMVGYSMGALTAFLLAATQPDLVRMLVLEEMPPPDPADPPRPIPREPDPDDDTDWHALIAVNRWRNAPDRSWWDLAGKISTRTLVLGGERSHLPQDRVEELASRIPDAEFVSIDLGHAIHTERPSAFLAAVEPFVAPLGK